MKEENEKKTLRKKGRRFERREMGRKERRN